MSAFHVGEYHVNALLSWARTANMTIRIRQSGRSTAYETRDDDACRLLGEILNAENQRSVNARYQTTDMPPDYAWRFLPEYRSVAPVAIIKACDCFEYQLAEFDGWEQSDAYRIIDAIRSRAIRTLPGYDAAPWALTKEAGS